VQEKSLEFKLSVHSSEGECGLSAGKNSQEHNNEKKFGKHDIAEIQNLAFKQINISEMDKKMEYILWRGKIGAPI
jgi:hypothetical protein